MMMKEHADELRRQIDEQYERKLQNRRTPEKEYNTQLRGLGSGQE